ncbi:MAG: hypothetical protein LBU85_07990 [Treponema sp.]|jgi:hypothetical protein|nr:hypothetical protein [Treponema sp.]
MKIKKTALCFALIAGIAASLSSCFSTHVLVVDENIPADQSATVTFVSNTSNGYFILSQWNNKDIVKDLYGDRYISSDDKTVLTVPAGSNSFTFTVEYIKNTGTRSITYTFKDMEMRYDLEPEKEYKIKGRTELFGFFKYAFFIGIYDAADELLKEWKIGEEQ